MTSSTASLRPARLPAVRSHARAWWELTRPHTIIGTSVSILGLYAIAVVELPGVGPLDGLGDLAWTLLAGLCVNVYIVAVNQLEDVEIDRVNKPFLPLAAGTLTPAAVRRAVALCGAVPLVLALSQGAVETLAVLAALVVGTAYSVPPLRLKRFPLLASLSITGVRAIVVNLGVAAHFSRSLGETWVVPAPVWALTLFVVPFAFAIAILKDVPDAAGDRRFRIATFTLRLGGRRVLRSALVALTAAYLGMAIAGPLLLRGCDPLVLVAGQLAALALLWSAHATADPAAPAAFTRFYMRVWKLFFLQYLLVPLACAVG